MNITFLTYLGLILIGLGLYIILKALSHERKAERVRMNEEIYEYKPEPLPEKKVEGGGVILIGPIPIVFGTNWKHAVIALILTIILMILVFVMVIGWR